MKSYCLLSGAAASLLGASVAAAGFTGVGMYQVDAYFADHSNANVQAAWNTANPGGVGLDVYRIYAEFDADDLEVTSVFGDSTTGQAAYLSNLTSGSFWNYVQDFGFFQVHSDTPPASSKFGSASSAAAAFDTFATIGKTTDDNATSFATDMVNALNISSNLQTNWNTDNTTNGKGGWGVTGFPVQGIPTLQQPGLVEDGVYRVLLMQVTVAESEVIEGQFGVRVATPDARGNESEFYGSNTYFSNVLPVPAPGAVTLIGLAGVFSRRRRRG